MEPLSVVPFEIQKGARFQTEVALRRGRKTTAALSVSRTVAWQRSLRRSRRPRDRRRGRSRPGWGLRPLSQSHQTHAGEHAPRVAPLHAGGEAAGGRLRAGGPRAIADRRAEQMVDNYGERVKETVKLLTAGATKS